MVVPEDQRPNVDGRPRFSGGSGDLRLLFTTIGSHGQSLENLVKIAVFHAIFTSWLCLPERECQISHGC